MDDYDTIIAALILAGLDEYEAYALLERVLVEIGEFAEAGGDPVELIKSEIRRAMH